MKYQNNKSIKIASWNIEGRLSDICKKSRGNPSHIIQSIKELDADILVLLEAHSENTLTDQQDRYDQIADMGYNIYEVPYEDDIPTRPDSPFKQLSLMLLTKIPVIEFSIIRLGDLRNALQATISINKSTKIRVIGVHLDDRLESTRLRQVSDLAKIVNQSDIPTIVMGDYNAMHGTDLWPAKVLRSTPVRLISKVILPKLSIRAVEMARGETLKLLEKSTNLVDADSLHRPTITPQNLVYSWLPNIRLIQIDHMYISPDINISEYKIAPDGGADHRAISALINIKM